MAQKITGIDRTDTAKDLAELYYAGDSIRAIVARTGHTYGLVRRLLLEAGVRLRPRGYRGGR